MLLQDMRKREAKFFGNKCEELNEGEIRRFVKKANYRSMISNQDKKLKLTRWICVEPFSLNNLVLMNNKEFQEHILLKNRQEVFDKYGEKKVNEIESFIADF